MRISLNLAVAETPRERYALVWSLPVLIIGLASIVLFANVALKEFREYRVVHRELAGLIVRNSELNSKEAGLIDVFKHPQSVAVSQEASFVNSLIQDKHFSMTGLAAKVIKLLPSDVRLTGMSLSRMGVERTVRFSVAGKDEDAVESFLSNLESSPDFKNVGLEDQGFKPTSDSGGLITISCSAEYVETSPEQNVGN